MPDDIFGAVRDVLVVLYMFALRIGVPILITLMLGAWLQRLLQEPESEPAPKDLKAGAHCWEIKRCSETRRAECAAACNPDLPCWLALQVNGQGLQESCYNCPLFTSRAVPVRSQ